MAVTIGASLLAGGALALALFGPSLAGAAPVRRTLPPRPPPRGVGWLGGFTSNEDPAHEAAESPEREAEENSARRSTAAAGTRVQRGPGPRSQ